MKSSDSDSDWQKIFSKIQYHIFDIQQSLLIFSIHWKNPIDRCTSLLPVTPWCCDKSTFNVQVQVDQLKKEIILRVVPSMSIVCVSSLARRRWHLTVFIESEDASLTTLFEGKYFSILCDSFICKTTVEPYRTFSRKVSSLVTSHDATSFRNDCELNKIIKKII